MSAVDVVGTLAGFVTIILGVFMLHAFRDLDMSRVHLPHMHKAPTPAPAPAPAPVPEEPTVIRLEDKNILVDNIELTSTALSQGKPQELTIRS